MRCGFRTSTAGGQIGTNRGQTTGLCRDDWGLPARSRARSAPVGPRGGWAVAIGPTQPAATRAVWDPFSVPVQPLRDLADSRPCNADLPFT